MKRNPSKPWSGCPPVWGISAAVMPMRSVPPRPCVWATVGAQATVRAMSHANTPLRICQDMFASLYELLLHPHRDQVLEPGLRLHIAFDLGAQRPRVEVVHNKDPGRILNNDLVHPG